MYNFLYGFTICLLFMQHDALLNLLSLHLLQIYAYLKFKTSNLVIQKEIIFLILKIFIISSLEYYLLKYFNIRLKLVSKIGTTILVVSSVLIQYSFDLNRDLLILSLYFLGHNLYLNTFISLIIFLYLIFNYNLKQTIIKKYN